MEDVSASAEDLASYERVETEYFLAGFDYVSVVAKAARET